MSAEREPAPLRRLIPVRMVDTTPPKFIVPPVFTDDEGLTVMFGDGGSGKTSLGAGIVVTLAATVAPVSGLVRVGEARPAVLLPYEAPRGLARRIVGLLGSADAPVFLAPEDVMVRPLWEGIPLAAEIARVELAEHGGTRACLLVDSISFGLAGQSTSADEPPTLTAAAVARARVPVLATAHQNRAGDDTKPFGSAFWHNAARMTWHVKMENGLFVLTCRKANDHDMYLERRTYRPEWADEGVLAGLSAVVVKVDTSEMVRSALLAMSRPLTVTEISAAGCGGYDAVDKTLHRHPDLFVRTGAKGTPWALREWR